MADDLVKILDRVKRTQKRLLTQFQGQPTFDAFAAAYGQQFQEIEDMFFDLYIYRGLSMAFGQQLDELGELLKEKRGGKSDENYRAALYGKIAMNKGNGTIEDVIFALNVMFDGDYYLKELGSATLRMRLMGQRPTDIDAATFNAALQRNRGAGVEASFIWSEYSDSNTWRWATGSTRESTSTNGWSDVAKTYGGKRTGVLQ